MSPKGGSIFRSLRQTSHATTQPIEKETNKQALSVKWWSYFLREQRKTNMGKQGKPQKNRRKPRKTGETWKNRGKQRKTRKNKENQGKIYIEKHGKTGRIRGKH